ncbi:MAG TPA: Fic/DOC family N-terminal domain-containing protein [Alphaproteobacteria bacterium]|nr:Fic/DOC family N-terminal domain-containing protein [Alphaproteobacteria bacterium]
MSIPLPDLAPLLRPWERAEAAVARFDQALRLSPVAGAYLSLARLHEAVRSAALDGLGTTPEAVLRVRLDPAAAGQDKASRAAVDIAEALELAARRPLPEALSPEGLAELAERAERLSRGAEAPPDRGDLAWQAESWLEAARLHGDWPGLLAAGAGLRELLLREAFGPACGRVARLALPLLLARAGKTAGPSLLLSERLSRRGGALEVLARGGEAAFHLAMLEAFAGAAEDGLRRLATLALLRETLRRRCPGRRNTSSLGRAVDLVLAAPLLSARHLRDRLGLSLRGAHMVIDQLAAARVLVEATGRSRDRLFMAPEVLAW